MKRIIALGLVIGPNLVFTIGATSAFAGISIDPYVSISSTKTITPDSKNKSSENQKEQQRTTYGLRFSLGIYRLFKFQLGVGQNQSVSTQKAQVASDEFNEIDYNKDLKISIDEPDKEMKITEIQKKATASLLLDPSFSIFILRAKAGIQAQQRYFKKEETGKDPVVLNAPITYKPLASVGAGVKIGRTMHAIAEYGFYFYSWPKKEPFEREVSISYGFSF